MQQNWQKILLISLFVGAVILFALLLYFFFFKPIFLPSPPTVVTPAATTTPGQLPGAGTGGVTPTTGGAAGGLTPSGQVIITPTTVPSPIAQGGLTEITPITTQATYFSTLSSDGQLTYYNNADGKFYRVDANGKITAYSDKVFNSVSNVVWSNSRDKAVLQYPDGSNILYDFASDKQYTLPKHWQEFSFSPNDQQIAFKNMAIDQENRFLAITKYDGSNAKIIEEIGGSENNFTVNWSPNNQMVATFQESKDGARSEVYFIGLNNENFKSMVVEGRGFSGIWSPTGDKMLYSVYTAENGYTPTLWASSASGDAIGANRQPINLQTWAEKCSFADNNTVYCAVPSQMPYGASVDPTITLNIKDNIFKIDLTTGVQKLVAVPEGNHTVGQLFSDASGNYLYFSDANNNQIYKINLK